MSSPDMFESTPSDVQHSQSTNPPSSPMPKCSSSNKFCESFTPPTPTPEDITPTPPTPSSTPVSPPVPVANTKAVCCKIKIDFLDSEGNRIKLSSCSDSEVISIVSSMVKSNSVDFCKSTVNKICESDLFKDLIEERVLQKLSNQFQTFISKEECPLRVGNFLAHPELLADIDYGNLLSECFNECPNLVNALSMICLGCSNGYRSIVEDSNKKHQKQRLLALMAIGAFTRNQKVNLYQKVIGEFLKRRNTSKHCLQFLQRVGLSLVTVSIRSDQQKMGSNFLKDVSERKADIELWAHQRKILDRAVKCEAIEVAKANNSVHDHYKVIFVGDDTVEAIKDLSEFQPEEDSVLDDPFILKMMATHGSASKSLEAHLDLRPKLQDVTYDNIGTSI